MFIKNEIGDLFQYIRQSLFVKVNVIASTAIWRNLHTYAQAIILMHF